MGRTIIFGAGAIGGVVGGHLARSGHDVVLIGRPAHVEAIRRDGLRFVTPQGTLTLHAPAFSAPSEIAFASDDVICMCMKGQDSEAALLELHAVAPDVPVFCFQNGVRNEEIASGYFARVYGVMVHVGGVYLTPGEVISRRDPPGSLAIGCYPSGQDELADSLGEDLRSAGFRVLVTPTIMPYKWGKLIGNLANAIIAATDGQDPGGDIARAVRGEAAALLKQAGIAWIPWEDAQRQFPELNTPDRGAVAVKSHGSTWQSLQRGEGTVETEFLNGEIVRLAERLGAAAPINAALVRVAQDMAARGEKPGRYSPEELSALLGVSR